MRFIGIREFRTRTRRVWQELSKEKELVVTSNGKPVAILTAVDEGRLEESLRAIRRSRAIDAVSALQRGSVTGGTYRLSSSEIEAEIKAERRQRSE